MKEADKELTSEESLKIITRMIHQAKGNITEASFHFILWGWVGVIASFSHYFLSVYTDFNYPYLVWLIGIPAWIISFYHGYKNASKQRVRTYSDSLVMWTWIAFTLCILIIIFAGELINYHISAMILVLAAFATFMTGKIIHFKPLIAGGVAFWFFAIAAFWVGPKYSQLVIGFAFLAGYLIPAYMLKKS